jgi:uncharacterized protein (DUF305 family)
MNEVRSINSWKPLLYAAAVLSLTAGLSRLWVVPEHLGEWWVYGVFFLAAALAQGLYGVLLLRWPTGPVFLLGLGGNLVLAVFDVVAGAIGAPSFGTVVGGVGALGAAAIAAELIAVLALVGLVVPVGRGKGETRAMGTARSRPAGAQLSPIRLGDDLAVLLAIILAVIACVVSLALLASSRPPGEDSAEAGFARDMMVHHAQAVEMAEIVRDKTKSEEIRFMAADMVLTQQAQIGMMQGWLTTWGLPVASTEPAMSWMGHPTEGLMPGMATPEEIDRLREAPPEEADKLFLKLMIEHHKAAIPMAEAVLERTHRPEVQQLAEAISSSQRTEIQTMQEMLRDRGAAPVEDRPSVPHHGHEGHGS